MDLPHRLDNVITCLRDNNFTIPTLIRSVLESSSNSHYACQESLLFGATDICSDLFRALESKDSKTISSWVFDVVTKKLCREVTELARKENGLHFNASNTTAEYLEGSFMVNASQKIKKVAPDLWVLLYDLLDANPLRRRTMPTKNDAEIIEGLAADAEGDLGEIGEDVRDDDTNMNEDLEDDVPGDEQQSRAKKRRIRAATRNSALLTIKTVVAVSIILQSTNERCNYLQSVLGIFFHSTSVPEKVIEMLAHAGLSISLSSIHKAVKSLSHDAGRKLKEAVRTLQTAFAYDNFDINFKSSEPTVERPATFVSATSATAIPLYGVGDSDVLRCSAQLWEKDTKNPSPSSIPVKLDVDDLSGLHAQSSTRKATGEKLSPLLKAYAWHIRFILVHRGEYFGSLAPHLGQPDTVNQIPIHQTTQIPCRSMNVKESTPDGNIEVLECLLRQGGIGEPTEKNYDVEYDVDMTDSVLLVHGDLLTKERLDTVQGSRCIESTPKRRFQYVVFLPGLFHLKMACADAIWRTWVQPPKSRTDENSLYQHVGILRPGDTGKFGTKPGFRQVHDVVHHDIWASMLDCWRLEAAARNPEWTSLQVFAKAKPNWEAITEMSESIVEKYVATTATLSHARDKRGRERDKIFENQTLRNRDELLYLELSHAMNAGDIGRVEATFLPWIYMFKATGKHKYGSQMLRFVLKMRDVYDVDLQKVIRLNWLCNPTGKAHAFRAVDWLVERNNLYTKVIYAGTGPNRTIEHIIQESTLIELYRDCHVTVENGFYLEHRTIRHTHPDMTKTLRKLRTAIERSAPHHFTKGRRTKLSIPDQIAAAMNTMQKKKDPTANDNDEVADVEADDLMDD